MIYDLLFSNFIPSLVKERDSANSDPRKSEIPIEIRSYEDKIDKLRRQIEDDQQTLRELRLSADSHNEISVLQEQVAKQVEALQESIDDQKYDLERFRIPRPEFPTAGGDKRGENLVIAVENLSAAVTEKFDEEVRSLENVAINVTSKERAVSEKSALLTHNRQTLLSSRARIDALTGDDGSVRKYQRVVSTMRRYAAEAEIATNFDENEPQTVLSFLDAQLEDLVDIGGDSMIDVAPKILKRLKKMVSWHWRW